VRADAPCSLQKRDAKRDPSVGAELCSNALQRQDGYALARRTLLTVEALPVANVPTLERCHDARALSQEEPYASGGLGVEAPGDTAASRQALRHTGGNTIAPQLLVRDTFHYIIDGCFHIVCRRILIGTHRIVNAYFLSLCSARSILDFFSPLVEMCLSEFSSFIMFEFLDSIKKKVQTSSGSHK
jgi:hypothetical protein